MLRRRHGYGLLALARVTGFAILLVGTMGLGLGRAQPAQLVTDLNLTPLAEGGSEPGPVTVLRGIGYFSATDGLHGPELWRSDGTEAGTWMVKDILAGESGSEPTYISVFGDTLVFVSGCGLWRSDGSESGTEQISPSFECYPILGQPIEFGGRLYFAAPGGLWSTDGTADGTARVEDATPTIFGLSSAAGRLFFFAEDGVHGFEPWTSDGTAEGTRLLADLTPGDASTVLRSRFVGVGERAFFTASLDGSDGGLWSTDGTSDGTTRILQTQTVAPSYPGSSVSLLATSHDLFLFVRPHPLIASVDLWHLGEMEILPSLQYQFLFPSGFELYDYTIAVGDAAYFVPLTAPGQPLWRSDGTVEGTVPLVAPTGSVRRLTDVDGNLHFSASDSEHGEEPWETDDTPAGSHPVADIRPGPLGSNPTWLSRRAGVNGDSTTLFLSADDGEHGLELFAANGDGVALVRNIADNAGRTADALPRYSVTLAAAGGSVIFNATDGAGLEHAWITDGTAVGTVSLADWSVSHAFAVPGGLAFNADGGFWRSDGTVAGTKRVGDFVPGEAVVVGADLVFAANDGALWRLDRDANVARKVVDLPGGAWRFTPSGGRLFFVALRELWTSDLSGDGTRMLHHFTNPSPIDDLVPSRGGLFFVIDDRELWRSDGTPSGTLRALDFRTIVDDKIRDVLPVGDKLLVITAHKWFVSDGTKAGTEELEVLGELGAGYCDDSIALDHGLFFLARIDYSCEAWFTDGTPEGTVRLSEVPVGNVGYGGERQDPTRVDDYVYFIGNSQFSTFEVWRTDGTPAGTVRLGTFQFDTAGRLVDYSFTNFTPVPGGMLFSAATSEFGREIWVTDGTATGTRLLQDIAPGVLSSAALDLDGHAIAAATDKVYFVADNKRTGNELWQVPIAALGLPCRGDCNGSGEVTVDELVGAVRNRLGLDANVICPLLDSDSDAALSMIELRSAVRAALRHC